MKKVFLGVACGIALTFAVAAVASQDSAIKAIPAADLSGITITGCEQKPASHTVSCRSGGKCTITVISERYTCKGLRK